MKPAVVFLFIGLGVMLVAPRAALAGCEPGPEGIGGTGLTADPEGMGGTGILGTITAFGSICVNGLKVEYDDQTPVLLEGGTASTRHLAIGQMVAVDAAPDAAGRLQARTIRLLPDLRGPVTASGVAGELRVMGRSVRLGRDTTVVSPHRTGPEAVEDLTPGTPVRVYGLRMVSGDLRATRIEADEDGEARVRGRIQRVEAEAAVVDGIRVVPPARGDAERWVEGADVEVVGRYVEGRLVADRVDSADAARVFEDAGRSVSIEGLAESEVSDGAFRLRGRTVRVDSAADGSTVSIRPDRRLVVTGRWEENGEFRARHIELRERVEVPAVRGSGRGAADSNVDRVENVREEHGDRAERQERGDRAERPERAERVERAERPERAERVERVERAERPERVERTERVERPERPERAERTDRVERPERVDRPERAERPERSER